MTRYLVPDDLAEACELLAADPWSTKVISGGTALVLMMRQGLVSPDTLVSLERLTDLRGVEVRDGALRIGARTTLTEVAASPLVRQHAPALAYAASRVGNVRIRNAATLGGNVAEADYASDPPSVLIGLDARCTLQGATGSRSMPVREVILGFFTTALEPDEIVTAITVPIDPTADRRSVYLKYISRSSEDRPCTGVAATADFVGGTVDRLTVVVGAVAPIPQRFDEITRIAVGTRLGPDVRDQIAREYAASIEAMDDARGSAWYRQQMTEVFVRRALADLADPADPPKDERGRVPA